MDWSYHFNGIPTPASLTIVIISFVFMMGQSIQCVFIKSWWIHLLLLLFVFFLFFLLFAVSFFFSFFLIRWRNITFKNQFYFEDFFIRLFAFVGFWIIYFMDFYINHNVVISHKRGNNHHQYQTLGTALCRKK